MSDTTAGFKRVFLGKVSDNALAAKKNDALMAVAAITVAVNTAANSGTPPLAAALDKVRAQATKLGIEANAARPNGESAKDAWKAYEKIERAAAKQVQAAEALELAAGKLAAMKNDMAQVGGIEALDKRVAKIGDSAKTTEEKATLIAAMQARYGLDLVAGELSTKALPKLYKVFGMVPESHARLNDSLKILERTKSNEESDYNKGDLRIRINAGETGRFSTLGDSKYKTGTGKTVKLEHFTVTTLHEIGHAVDEDNGYMDAHQAAGDHGKWVATDADSIAAIADTQKGFATRFPTIVQSARLALLRQALVTGALASPQATNEKVVLQDFEPDNWLDDDELEDLAVERGKLNAANQHLTDNSVNGAYVLARQTARAKFSGDPFQQAIAGLIIEAMEKGPGDVASAVGAISRRKEVAENYPPATEFGAILADPAVAWLISLRMRDESTGLWSDGKAGATTAAIGDVVYQESYKGKYWTYSLAARNKQVSDYQFRAPAEWYAEAYAMFFLKKLPKDHPLYAVLKADVDA